MKWKITNRRTCLNLISAIILLAGLGSAIFIYLTADNVLDSILGYEVAGGDVYPVTPDNSKMYAHDLELYGGKAAVLANDFRYWFVGLWHGRSLAFTVASITILISFGVFFVANHLPSDLPSDVQEENNRRGKYFNP
ncbi:MAG TPA: hypothetical protein VL197_08185 [Nitrospirota bacterium]|nr:hypothetical protein [Nitrospirota bacterium]